ncbi:unnamed protein product [Brassica oleracea var. botrytis]|nr:unnamed protein product [Brassica oleracea]
MANNQIMNAQPKFQGENGESRIGIRKAAPPQSHISSSVVSKESMHHGLIATATMLLTPNVQWDEAATISRPTKVSPWEIDPLIPSSNILNSDFQKEKRQREINEFGDVTSEQNYNDQMVQSAKENLTTNASGSFRLFGVDLTASTKARDVLEPLDSYQKGKISESFEEEKLDQIQEVTSLTEIQRKEISFSTSSTKIEMTILSSQTLDMFIDQVHMEGIGRTVDLTIFDGYNIADADH